MPAALPDLTAGRALTTWTLDPLMDALALVLAAGYLLAVHRVRSRGGTWSPGRTALFVLGGAGTLVVATSSCLAVYAQVLLWPAAVANTVLSIITPIGLALGDPVTLVQRAWPGSAGPRLVSVLRGRTARFLMFPLVSVVLGVATPFSLYFTGYFTASLRSPLVHELLVVQLLLTGLLFVLPVLAEDLLPAWCTWPVRAAIAFADGLADALPGMVIALSGSLVAGPWYRAHPRTWGPTLHWDQAIAGTLMLTITEAVGIPLLLAVFIQWSRADASEAHEVDARLDAAEAAQAAVRAAEAAAGIGGELVRPWWETEPGALGGRTRSWSRSPED